MLQRQRLPVFADQRSHLFGHRAPVDAGRTHAENGSDELLIGQGGRAALPELFAQAGVFGQVFDRAQEGLAPGTDIPCNGGGG